MLLLSIFFLLLITQSCKTWQRLPADEPLPVLDSSDLKSTAVDLLFQHYYWKLWANDARYLIGEITSGERDERRKAILDEIAKMADN